MNDNIEPECTPERVISELVPADLTPEAIILGQQPEADIIWWANIVMGRGPGADPELVMITGTCVVINSECGYDEMALETCALNGFAEEAEIDPRGLMVISFRWATLAS